MNASDISTDDAYELIFSLIGVSGLPVSERKLLEVKAIIAKQRMIAAASGDILPPDYLELADRVKVHNKQNFSPAQSPVSHALLQEVEGVLRWTALRAQVKESS